MEVHVLIFEHRHGRDVSAHATEELAVAEAAEIARRWWSEARRRERSLPAAPPGSDAEAMSLYFAAQEGEELLEIAGCEVGPPQPPPAGEAQATPAASRITGAEAIEALYEAARDPELAILDEIVERAGLGWRCRASAGGSRCSYMNVGAPRCGGRGAGEEEGRKEGDG